MCNPMFPICPPFKPGKGSKILWQIVDKEKDIFSFNHLGWQQFNGDLGRGGQVPAG